uniref:OTU domain-containing protein n=1 Tax=Ascaris lumbricoides TaxID=6252 RepID=A0A0M3ITL2_ASCLU
MAKLVRTVGRLERAAIEEILTKRGLSLHEIPPDGDCLYNAIAHQISLLGVTPAKVGSGARLLFEKGHLDDQIWMDR